MTSDAAMAIIKADNEIVRLKKMKMYSKFSSHKTIDKEIRELNISKNKIYEADKSIQSYPATFISAISLV